MIVFRVDVNYENKRKLANSDAKTSKVGFTRDFSSCHDQGFEKGLKKTAEMI
ncbi:MAG: hypothetical protein GY849_12980 [Deltaproteobacteria bacterium]|nr:hypothetical protein [Deltaproteobacteria bacterium]